MDWEDERHEISRQEMLDLLHSKGRRPLGKLLKSKHREEVAERDGRDGRELWCAVGQFVYNITGGFSPYYPLGPL